MSPPYISVCLRAGWSLPGVQSRYLHFQEAGDQYVGRAVTGLNPLTSEFSISPPYFQGHDTEVSLYVVSLIPENSSDQMKILMKFLIASVLFHREFLIVNVHPNSRFRSTTIMMNDTPVRGYVRTRYAWDIDTNGHAPRITGVPPHVSLLNSMELVVRTQNLLPDVIATRVQQVLESNTIQNGGLTAAMVLQVVEAQLQRLIVGQTNQTNQPGNTQRTNERRYVNLHYYGGLWHKLPQNFLRFPSLTFGNLVTRWLLPDLEQDIPAFKYLRTCDVKRVSRGRKTLNDMKKLMGYVKTVAEELDAWKDEWTAQDVTVLLTAVSHRFHLNHTRVRRNEQVTWFTVLRTWEKARSIASSSNNNN